MSEASMSKEDAEHIFGTKKASKVLENRVERELVKRVNDLGGMCEKFTSPGRRSVPDRLVTLPGGRIIFVECKAPGKEPTLAQQYDHERRRLLGCDVRVIDNIEDARAFP
jgi:Holliday junction resolvase